MRERVERRAGEFEEDGEDGIGRRIGGWRWNFSFTFESGRDCCGIRQFSLLPQINGGLSPAPWQPSSNTITNPVALSPERVSPDTVMRPGRIPAHVRFVKTQHII
jgi:hypothetical protein